MLLRRVSFPISSFFSSFYFFPSLYSLPQHNRQYMICSNAGTGCQEITTAACHGLRLISGTNNSDSSMTGCGFCLMKGWSDHTRWQVKSQRHWSSHKVGTYLLCSLSPFHCLVLPGFAFPQLFEDDNLSLSSLTFLNRPWREIRTFHSRLVCYLPVYFVWELFNCLFVIVVPHSYDGPVADEIWI